LKKYEGEPGKAGAAKDHRTDLLSPVIVRHRTYHRSFDFIATNKPRKAHGHAGEESTTTTKATSPTSLNTIDGV
jgi:hypothetical protein